MHLTISTVLSLLFSCSLQEVEAKARNFLKILEVTNGGKWGEWGKIEFCPEGYVDGFSLKMSKERGILKDDTALNGIRLYCSDGAIITSSVGKFGTWSDRYFCWFGFLSSFSLRASPPEGIGDDTAANNIKFKCEDEVILEGNGPEWGTYSKWSDSCGKAAMCGLQTKVENPKGVAALDRTELNDVKFFCCEYLMPTQFPTPPPNGN